MTVTTTAQTVIPGTLEETAPAGPSTAPIDRSR